MSSIPYNVKNRNEISNSVTNFMKEFQIGQFLFETVRWIFCQSEDNALSIFGKYFIRSIDL